MKVLWIAAIVMLVGCSTMRSSPREREQVRRTHHDGDERLPARAGNFGATVLSSLRSVHPRLLVTDEDFSRTRELIAHGDPLVIAWHERLHAEAEKILGQPPLAFQASLLSTSREAFLRITTLAGLGRLDHEQRFVDRARIELLAVCKFPNWEPADFLATAEMSAAVAIGYDWLFDQLPPRERASIRDALIEKGIAAGLHEYQTGSGWTSVHHNWNFVCNGGLILASLAVADEEPTAASRMISIAVDSMRDAFVSFAPDGGWEEGPAYWNYATRYAIYAIAGLQTAVGTDDGLSKARGFDRTGLFRIYAQGPTGKLFNFSDCDEHTMASPQMLWMARAFGHPEYATFEALSYHDYPAMLDLLWFHPPTESEAVKALPLNADFQNVAVAILRSSWTDPNATFIGFKGGSTEAHHGHLDLGSFVLDALGQRWAIDLGADDYDLPGYGNGAQRWTYYRCRTEGHNTLTIDDANQELSSAAPLIGFDAAAREPYAIVDLTHAYFHGTIVLRGVKMIGRSVLIQDEIDIRDRARATWHFHTRAPIELNRVQDPSTAILRQNGKAVRLEILSPSGMHFEIRSASSAPPQDQQPDVRDLIIRCDLDERKTTTIAVLVSPIDSREEMELGTAARKPMKLEPLQTWKRAQR